MKVELWPLSNMEAEYSYPDTSDKYLLAVKPIAYARGQRTLSLFNIVCKTEDGRTVERGVVTVNAKTGRISYEQRMEPLDRLPVDEIKEDTGEGEGTEEEDDE